MGDTPGPPVRQLISSSTTRFQRSGEGTAPWKQPHETFAVFRKFFSIRIVCFSVVPSMDSTYNRYCRCHKLAQHLIIELILINSTRFLLETGCRAFKYSEIYVDLFS